MTFDIPEAEKTKRLSRLIKIRNKRVNIMLVGSTGIGESRKILGIPGRIVGGVIGGAVDGLFEAIFG